MPSTEIPTFFVAGHETTSTAVTWALFALSQNIDIQNKLREEVSSLSTSSPTADELASISYLDYVVREVLRLYAPAPNTLREAIRDDIIPLSGDGCIDKNGVKRNSIRYLEFVFIYTATVWLTV
jgi:cytochrome P450